MRYELFEASFIDELIILGREYRTHSIDDGRTLKERNDQFLTFAIGKHKYFWEKGFGNRIKIVANKVEYGANLQSLNCNYANKEYIRIFCQKYGIVYTIHDDEIGSQYRVKQGAKLITSQKYGETSFDILLRLQLTPQKENEIYLKTLHSEEQNTLRQLGHVFCEKVKQKDVVTIMSEDLVSEERPVSEEKPIVYSILVGKKGAKSKRSMNGGHMFSEFKLRDLQSDDEMIGFGLAVLEQVAERLQNEGGDAYSFTLPRIKYAILPMRNQYNLSETNSCLGAGYALELSMEVQRKKTTVLSDW